jgi:hypothetical protein
MDGLVGLLGPLVNGRLTMTAQVPNPGGPAEFAKSIDEQRDPCQGGEGSEHGAEIAQHSLAAAGYFLRGGSRCARRGAEMQCASSTLSCGQ